MCGYLSHVACLSRPVCVHVCRRRRREWGHIGGRRKTFKREHGPVPIWRHSVPIHFFCAHMDVLMCILSHLISNISLSFFFTPPRVFRGRKGTPCVNPHRVHRVRASLRSPTLLSAVLHRYSMRSCRRCASRSSPQLIAVRTMPVFPLPPQKLQRTYHSILAHGLRAHPLSSSSLEAFGIQHFWRRLEDNRSIRLLLRNVHEALCRESEHFEEHPRSLGLRAPLFEYLIQLNRCTLLA